MSEEIKVGYYDTHGSKSKAYVDSQTLEGINKFNDRPIKLRYDAELREYHEIENFFGNMKLNLDTEIWERIPEIQDTVTLEELSSQLEMYRKRIVHAKSDKAREDAQMQERFLEHHIWIFTHYKTVQRLLQEKKDGSS